MSYRTIIEMNGSISLRDRIVAAVAQKIPGSLDPVTAVQEYMWALIAREEWADAWESARSTYTDVYNPDTGARPDVITDAMISSAIDDITTP